MIWKGRVFMRQGRSLKLALINILGLIALAGWSMPLLAQAPHGSPPAPAGDINPPVANCNVTPDTIPDPAQPGKRIAKPITGELLASGQPCQQVVNTQGLLDGNPLGNLQRGFDFYSWLTFIAMNSPADGKTIGQGPRPGGDAFTKWEDLANFRPLGDVMLAKGTKPTWGTASSLLSARAWTARARTAGTRSSSISGRRRSTSRSRPVR